MLSRAKKSDIKYITNLALYPTFPPQDGNTQYLQQEKDMPFNQQLNVSSFFKFWKNECISEIYDSVTLHSNLRFQTTK